MKQLAQKLIVLVVALAAGLAATEAILAWKGLPRFHRSHSTPGQFDFTITDDEELRYTNLPSTEITFVYYGNPTDYAVSHQTNSLGFRGPEFLKTRPVHRKRIAFLGDSFTFGEGVRDDRTFAVKTARYLNAMVPEGEPTRYESLNFGVGGYNTHQTLQLLEETVLDYRPDIAVLGFTLNDAEPDLFFYNRETGKTERRERENEIHEGVSDPRPPDTFFYKLRLTKLIWQVIRSRRITAETIDYYDELFEEGSEGWESARRALRSIIEVCDENGIECCVMLFPIFYRLDDNYPFTAIHEKIAAEVRSANGGSARFIDLFPEYKGIKDTDLWVHPTDQHPNERAHEIAARKLAEVIASGWPSGGAGDATAR